MLVAACVGTFAVVNSELVEDPVKGCVVISPVVGGPAEGTVFVGACVLPSSLSV